VSARNGDAKDSSNQLREIFLRWLKFNAVGALGIAVQLTFLFMLKSYLHLNYLLATAFAVELTVIHNFLWHKRYTWADRVCPSRNDSWLRFVRFNLTNGGISILGNLALMAILAGWFEMNYLAANCVAIALCSILNFLLSETWVFAK
jgi:dolichol-phosphate mannosyltransferase